MTGSDQQIRDLLVDAVDAAVGPPRRPPAFRVPAPEDGRFRVVAAGRRAWPVLAAAAAVAVVSTVAAVGLPDRGPDPAAPTVSPRPQPTTRRLDVGGARFTLPDGWTARRETDVATGVEAFCLVAPGPSSHTGAVGAAGVDECAVSVRAYVRPAEPLVDADNPEGAYGNPAYCEDVTGGGDTRITADAAAMGSRTAEHRVFDVRCAASAGIAARTWRVESYVLTESPAYTVSSARTDEPAVREALRQIARTAEVPAARGLRLYDRGTFVRVQVVAGGYRVTVQPTRMTHRGDAQIDVPVPGAAARTYLVPADTFAGQPSALRVGTPLGVWTDGTRVLSVAQV